LLDGPGTAPRALTADGSAIHLFGGWHPDGETFALSSNARDERFFDVELITIAPEERRMLWQTDATSNAGLFSPDGGSLLVRREDPPSDHCVFSVTVQSGSIPRLTPGGTPAVYEGLGWSNDGQRIYAVTDVGREYRALVAIDV